MKLIIEIDEKIINQAKHYHDIPYDDYVVMTAEALANGTPLPKGHGALIDRDVLQRYIEQDKQEAFTKHQVWLLASVYNEGNVPVIVEADKEVEKT